MPEVQKWGKGKGGEQMRKLFQAIRKQENQEVRALIEKKPELVYCVAKQPPKMDDGQSPLQVALKTGNFDMANFLLDQGVDVHFMEAESCCNRWRAPVIHDAINAAVMRSRWNVNCKITGELEVHSTQEKALAGAAILERIIGLGADVNAKDAYGNACLDRACLQASQILPSYDRVEKRVSDDRILTQECKRTCSGYSTCLWKARQICLIFPQILGRRWRSFMKMSQLRCF